MGGVGNGIIAVVITVITVMITFIMMPTMMDSLDESVTEPQTDSLYSSTGVGETTDTVTLTQPLWDDATTRVTTITSTNGSDTPTASTYASSTRVLTIAGLAASGTRTFTITYDADAVAEFTGFGDFVQLAPLLIVTLIVFAILGAMFLAFKGHIGNVLRGG